MSKYGIKYHIELKNAEKDAVEELVNTMVYCDIYDRSLLVDDSATVQVIDVVGSDSVIKIATIDNDEDKFTPVKALQATINFLSDGSVSASTFADAPIPAGGEEVGDPRWYVEIYLNDTDNIIFKGFLNIDDCSEPFLPNPNIVTLTANDGLGTLKNIALVNFSDAVPRGYYRIADYFAWALNKTGLELNLQVICNIREANNPDSHLFDSCYEWSKTFEDEIGTCENCYEVLDALLTGLKAFLTQRNGEWWIIRIDDVADENDTYVTTFDPEGVVGATTIQEYQKTIGYTEAIFFSQEQTNVTTTRPYKFVKETYRFEFPKEIIDNIDFSRGEGADYFFTENFTEDGIAKVRRRYTLQDWALLENFAGITSDTEAYIERIFEGETDQEKERYAVVEATAGGGYYYIQSNPVLVHEKDKFNLSVDARYSEDISGSSGQYTHFTIQVRLYATDGTYWTLENSVNQPAPPDPPILPEWKQTNAAFSTNNGYVYQHGYLADDLTQWMTSSVEATPIPKDGKLVIQLLHAAVSDAQDRHFSNLQFTYIPYIDGSYQKYSGLSYKAFRSIDYNAKREEDVKISDGLKKLFKGALFRFDFDLLFQASTDFFFTEFDGIEYGTLFLPLADVRSYFTSGDTFRTRNTTYNNQLFTVVRVDYTPGTGSTIRTKEVPLNIETANAIYERATPYLANEFFNYQKTQSPTADDIHPFAWFQVFDVWNQYRNVTRKFEATCQGLTSSEVDANDKADLPHLIYRYTLSDQSNHTTAKTFMLLTFEWDLYTCEWTGTLMEVYNQSQGKFYDDTDNLEIKYVQ